MTSNAELIAESRKWVRLHQANKYQAEAARRMTHVLDALEAAEQRAEEAERERDRLDEAFDRDLPWRYDEVEAQRNQLAAVLEKVRVYAREMRDRASMNAQQGGEFWQGMTIKGRENADDLDALIATAPADALRDVKAAAWDEGWDEARDCVQDPYEQPVETQRENPYRQRREEKS